MMALGLFTRIVAAALVPVFLLAQATPLMAAGSVSTIAIIGPPSPVPADLKTVWIEAVDRVTTDPMLLARDEKRTQKILRDWLEETDALEESIRAAALGLRGKSREILDDAWASYYRFDFEGSLNLLKEITPLVPNLHDTALQADTLFESLILEGMNRRALGDDHFDDAFFAAAAIKPAGKLTRDRYSPEIVGRYERVRKEVVSGPRSIISVEVDPMASRVIIDGLDMGNAPIQDLELTPGPHFIEAKRPGFEASLKEIVLPKWQPSKVEFHLHPAGPGAPPERFFADRVAAGDSASLGELARRLKADYVVLGWIDGDELKATLIDASGSPVSQSVLGAGDSRSPDDLLSMLEPLEWGKTSESSAFQSDILNVPEPREPNPELSDESRAGDHLKWYLVVGGVVLLAVAAGSRGSSGGGGSVEVTW